jgi:hypothetical protein
MAQLCHSNDFGSLWLCSLSDIRVLALLSAFQFLTYATVRVQMSFEREYEISFVIERIKIAMVLVSVVNFESRGEEYPSVSISIDR